MGTSYGNEIAPIMKDIYVKQNVNDQLHLRIFVYKNKNKF